METATINRIDLSIELLTGRIYKLTKELTRTDIELAKKVRRSKTEQRNRYMKMLSVATAINGEEMLERQKEKVVKIINRIKAEFDSKMASNHPNLKSSTRLYKSFWRDHKKTARYSIYWKQLQTINGLLKIIDNGAI